MDKLLALTVTGVLFMSNGVGAAAAPQTTCKAAPDIDKRVNYDFCVSQLLDHHESTMADFGAAGPRQDRGLDGSQQRRSCQGWHRRLASKAGHRRPDEAFARAV